MKLIKRSKLVKDEKGRKLYFSIFSCPYCLNEVEKQTPNGLKAKSCGCVMYKNRKLKWNIKHDLSNTRLYSIYYAVISRCLNPKNISYKNYGGRGIKVCPEWLYKKEGFINFKNWALNNGYADDLTIDRIDNNGNYEPLNCRWVTNIENQRKKRNVILSIEKANEIRELYKTDNYLQKELAKKFNIDKSVISDIVNNKIWINV